MAKTPRDFDLPPEAEPAPYELPPQPVNYVAKYQAAVEHIRKLEAEIEEYNKTAKVVAQSHVPGQFMIVTDDKGRMYERRPSPAPAGPGPQPMVWVRIPGPLVE